MIEFRIHGRGGQGNVAAAYLLATAAFEAGQTCQAFPAFGAERRGAPVTAFVRISDAPIHLRAQVREPDYLIVQDETLLQDGNITAGLKPGGGMIVNSSRDSATVSTQFNCRVQCLPATELAVEVLGKPIPNTSLLAGLLALTELLPAEALDKALADRFAGKVMQQNIALAARAAASVARGSWVHAAVVEQEQSDA